MTIEVDRRQIDPIPIKLDYFLNANRWNSDKESLRRKFHSVFSFDKAATYWVFGKRFVGKSSLLEAVATNHLYHGATVFDIFSARDNESLAWFRSPYKDILLVCGDSVELFFTGDIKPKWCHISEFNLQEAEAHQIVVTVPGFYSTDYEQYAALSRLVDLLKQRHKWNTIDLLLVREASRLLASRVMSGKVQNRMEAEYDFIELVQEAYHSGVGIAIDSLRPLSIEISIREIANYSFIKRMGRLSIPKEFNHVMSLVHPRALRKMPIENFVLMTDMDDKFVGHFGEIPWHIKRGEDIMDSLGIRVGRRIKEKKSLPATESLPPSTDSTKKDPVTEELQEAIASKHHAIVMMRYSEHLSYGDIAEKLGLKKTAVQYHLERHAKRLCNCRDE